MNKTEKIEYILEHDGSYDNDELRVMKNEELDDIVEELSDESGMFPNGRDYDVEDEDGV